MSFILAPYSSCIVTYGRDYDISVYFMFQRQLNAVDFRVSSDLNYILLIQDIKKVSFRTNLAVSVRVSV